MPRGPKGEKRPGDVIGAAILVGRIATGDAEDLKLDKDPHAVALGKRVNEAEKEAWLKMERAWLKLAGKTRK